MNKIGESLTKDRMLALIARYIRRLKSEKISGGYCKCNVIQFKDHYTLRSNTPLVLSKGSINYELNNLYKNIYNNKKFTCDISDYYVNFFYTINNLEMCIHFEIDEESYKEVLEEKLILRKKRLIDRQMNKFIKDEEEQEEEVWKLWVIKHFLIKSLIPVKSWAGSFINF